MYPALIVVPMWERETLTLYVYLGYSDPRLLYGLSGPRCSVYRRSPVTISVRVVRVEDVRRLSTLRSSPVTRDRGTD